ncbi:MAG: cell wall biogenesis protein [Acidiferrobacteraceae bacterium]|nr:cell wall biogenesis protein [Acidiferrobacteraceae bacterium]|tara:strand:+ start:1173 stop:2282 length:1110 start_codon:yes stop_codon:yes gene_type:complete
MEIKIPFFDYSALFRSHEEQLIKIFSSVAEKGAFIMQDELDEFEDNLANYLNIKYVLGVGNATDALEMLLKASGIGLNDEIIFCSHTMVATASAIKSTGARPVAVEAGDDHLIDPESIRAAITENTKGIMPTQLNGRISKMDEILEIAKSFNLKVFEDSAQALGAKYKGKYAGSFGEGGCISFYPAKILGCFGDGGAMVTNNQETYEKIKLFRDHGRSDNNEVTVWGFNSRLDNLQAAILNYFFQSFDQTVARRREIAMLYNNSLEGIQRLKLPPKPNDTKDNFDVFQNYEIEAEDRDTLKQYLENNGIGTMIQWGGKGVHQFRELGFKESLPNTELIMKRSLMLPLNNFITNDEVEYVAETIRGFYAL